MKTIQTIFTDETTLLIQGIKSKVDVDGNITDVATTKAIEDFIIAFKNLVIKS